MANAKTFTNLDVELGRLATRVETYLQENNFEVAFSKKQSGSACSFLIRAHKADALEPRDSHRRSTDITIRGFPDTFEVSVGSGEWGEGQAAYVPLFKLPLVTITTSIDKLYTVRKFEDSLWKFIDEQARFLSGSASATDITVDRRAYTCDYLGGYPGWNTELRGGRLILVREKEDKNYIIFESPRGQKIVIPATNIAVVELVKKKKRLRRDELTIQLACKDDSGTRMKLILNVKDNIIRGVMAGIQELYSEDRLPDDSDEVGNTPDVPVTPHAQIVKMLFLSANPLGTDQLALIRECNDIRAGIRSARYANKVEFDQWHEVTLSNLQRYMREYNPHIVHFSGHGTNETLVFQDFEGRPEGTKVDALANLFKVLNERSSIKDEDKIRCVVLNACFSERIARAISKNVECVVGMSNSVLDEAAIAFSRTFYGAIASGESIRDALELGKNQVEILGIPGQDIPKLVPRRGVYPSSIFLLGP